MRQPSAVDDWFYERRREEIRRVSSVERAEDFLAMKLSAGGPKDLLNVDEALKVNPKPFGRRPRETS